MEKESWLVVLPVGNEEQASMIADNLRENGGHVHYGKIIESMSKDGKFMCKLDMRD